MKAIRINIDEQKVLTGVNADVNIVFGVFGGMVREKARASMKPHETQTIRKHGQSRTSWIGRTPKGEPPRIRKGLIVNNIEVAQGQSGQADASVFIGPVALPSHNTQCLAILEYGDHPFMQPALKSTMPSLPEVWANSVRSQ